MNHTVFGTGFAVGLEELTNLEFDPNKPYRACLICGRVYQTNADRDLSIANNSIAIWRRKLWAETHARTHPPQLHRLLRMSPGNIMPDAANKLAAYGLIDVGGLVMNGEIGAAYRESSAIPFNDADDK